MKTKLSILLITALIAGLAFSTITARASPPGTVVRMISEKSKIGPNDVGSTFKLAVVVENVVDLYGFDIQLNWTTSLIKYVTHTTTVPRTSYPAPNPPSPYEGALNSPILPIKDIVNETDAIQDAEPGTTAWFAYASLGAPQGQTGSATIVVFTFNVTSPPVSEPVVFRFVRVDLSNMAGQPIPYEALDLTIPVETEHTVTVDETDFTIKILSNSTVKNLQLHAPEPKITFNVTGPAESAGFCNVTIPKSLIWTTDSWTVHVDGQPATFSITEDPKNTYVYITYEHSEHEITIEGTDIVAEFNSILPVIILLTLAAVLLTVLKSQKRILK
jgi:hypothetical protein